MWGLSFGVPTPRPNPTPDLAFGSIVGLGPGPVPCDQPNSLPREYPPEPTMGALHRVNAVRSTTALLEYREYDMEQISGDPRPKPKAPGGKTKTVVVVAAAARLILQLIDFQSRSEGGPSSRQIPVNIPFFN